MTIYRVINFMDNVVHIQLQGVLPMGFPVKYVMLPKSIVGDMTENLTLNLNTEAFTLGEYIELTALKETDGKEAAKATSSASCEPNAHGNAAASTRSYSGTAEPSAAAHPDAAAVPTAAKSDGKHLPAKRHTK